ncbi:MAG: serine hydrolase [Rhodoferax sp.]|nr:serine hydrolase [Rhodoferax sp.]
MRRCAGLLLAVWLALAAPVQAQPQSQPLDIGSDPALLARAALGSDPGSASVAVLRGDQLRVATVQRPAADAAPQVAGAGPAELAPLYEIGSISKVFTGLLLAQAVERGELSLSDTLGQRLQGKVAFASAAVAGITLEQLVTHRSCLPRQFGGVRTGAAVVEQIRLADRAALWAALAAQTLARNAPCPALYSNYGLAVLAELLAEHYGRPWSELVRDRITGPLGLQDMQLPLAEQRARLMPPFDGRRPAVAWEMQAFAGAGGLRSSAQDLARFGRALVQGRNGPLGAAAERLVTPLAAYRGGQIGYAVFIDGPPQRRTWSHDGLTGGYRAQMTIYPDSAEVLVMLAANWQAPLSAVNTRLAALRYPAQGTPITADPQRLAEQAGVYRIDPETVLVCVVHEGTLYVRATRGGFRAYLPVAADTYIRPAGGATLRFLRDGDRVESVELAQYGRTLGATRSAEPPPQQAVLVAGAAADFVGRYQVNRLFRAPIEFDVQEQDGQLVVRSSAVAVQPVFPVAGRPDRFHYESPNAQLQFERDAAGRVVALVLHENGELRAVRVPASP